MALTILYVEDHRVVAEAVKDMLEAEGWRVVLCYDGAIAIRRIASEASYDLLMFDNHLPNVNGLELVRYARQLPHRRQTPIIVLSASEARAGALSTGADLFLRKPQDVGLIAGAIKKLVGGEREHGSVKSPRVLERDF
ncbi:MAG: response regulator [Acidobacteriota bacterium]|nr:response regulator [Acidobacteriota bacterium]